MAGPSAHSRERGNPALWPSTGSPLSRGRADECLFRQMLAEEREHLAPRVHRLLGPVERPVPVIEAVARAIVAMKFVGLAVLLQRRLVLVHLLGAGRTVVVAEDAEERTRQGLGHVDGRNRGAH